MGVYDSNPHTVSTHGIPRVKVARGSDFSVQPRCCTTIIKGRCFDVWMFLFLQDLHIEDRLYHKRHIFEVMMMIDLTILKSLTAGTSRFY